MRFEAKLGKLCFGHCLTKMLFTSRLLHRPARHYVCAAKLQLLKFKHARRDLEDFKKGFEFKADTAPSSSFHWFEWSS